MTFARDVIAGTDSYRRPMLGLFLGLLIVIIDLLLSQEGLTVGKASS